MAKDTFFFTHDYNARNDPKLQAILMDHGCAGIGAFWCIIENLYEQEGYLSLSSCKCIAFALHVDCTLINSIIFDYDLFEIDEEKSIFWSKSVNNRLKKREEIAEKRKNAAIARWGNKKYNLLKDNNKQEEKNANEQLIDANEMHLHQFLMQDYAIKGKERKEEKRKEDIISIVDRGNCVKKFTPPTIFDVTEFVKNNNLNVDPERFFFYYESNGWKVGKNSMKSWTSALRNWSRNNLNVKTNQINNKDLSNKNYIERL